MTTDNPHPTPPARRRRGSAAGPSTPPGAADPTATPPADPATPDPTAGLPDDVAQQVLTALGGLSTTVGRHQSELFDGDGNSEIKAIKRRLNRVEADVSSLKRWRRRVTRTLSTITGDPVGYWKLLLAGVIAAAAAGYFLAFRLDEDRFDDASAWLLTAAAGIFAIAIVWIAQILWPARERDTTNRSSQTSRSTRRANPPAVNPDDPTPVAGTPAVVTPTRSGTPAS